MEISGQIKVITPIERFGQDFYKRSVVITTQEQYPQHISIDFLKNKADILDQYNVGDMVTVSINVNGREWTSPQGEVKYFNSLVGWKIEKQPLAQNAQQAGGDDDFIFEE